MKNQQNQNISLLKKQVNEIDKPLGKLKEERQHKSVLLGTLQGYRFCLHCECIYAHKVNSLASVSLNANFMGWAWGLLRALPLATDALPRVYE